MGREWGERHSHAGGGDAGGSAHGYGDTQVASYSGAYTYSDTHADSYGGAYTYSDTHADSYGGDYGYASRDRGNI